MAEKQIISVSCFGEEIGKLGFDEQAATSFFQYNAPFLASGKWRYLFPLIIRRMPQTQVFRRFSVDTFRSLPPAIADSLPDAFGNTVFKAWHNATRGGQPISVLEQLAYVGRRGMGALEYLPAYDLPDAERIDLDEITAIARQVIEVKTQAGASELSHAALLNIFKIGTSAGGARPKILVSQNRETGVVLPSDLTTDAAFDHYLVKLDIGDDAGYSRELVEYTYYLAASAAGIDMMPSKLIDGRHFATLRFDRAEGKKKHVLTASGIAGLDFMDAAVSSYEQLFTLAAHLKLPQCDRAQLFRRMVFNIVMANNDDHLKNHSFIFNELTDGWCLAPAYDLTYALNPLLTFTRTSRALSVNGKRHGITLADLNTIAETYAIKSPSVITDEVQHQAAQWPSIAARHGVPGHIIENIVRHFVSLG